ncbi:hypothetical protein Mal4_26810 [Maioricimonas rarisocia]|uniref:Uncharacterized protein n=1 Tax=Maioricimonas rarisocia TaxID=2528026 RepID=A0A517Z7C1_9PLAN|nr:hypothetical protein [Maioricimonas rarisocia]QDU38354.1 hypothetical protein Mal4_26810 [Maioricimonas rarisocia]
MPIIQRLTIPLLARLRNWWTYSPYDATGRLIMLIKRPADPAAFDCLGVRSAVVEQVLDGICDSFDIERHQKFQLRPADDLADIYRSTTRYRLGDDLEYERLMLKIEEWTGDFNLCDWTEDIHVTVGETIEFVNARLNDR